MQFTDGNIPVKYISARTIPEAFEKAMHIIWNEGTEIKTEYDIEEKEGRKDPPSKDATAIIEILEPFAEPRLHRAFHDSLENLGKYIHEVVNGVRDYRIKPKEEIKEESHDTRWTYTYHKRLFDYEMEDEKVNQIDYIIKRLSEKEYTRRAQAITWNVKLDPATSDPPCLQRILCRILRNGENQPVLNMNTHWRSRDLFKAWFENVIAMTELQKRIAEKISNQIQEKVLVGRYVDITDSLHIYGAYFKDVREFFAHLSDRTFEQRTWRTEFAKPFFKEGLEKLLHKEGKFMSQDLIKIIKDEIKNLEPEVLV